MPEPGQKIEKPRSTRGFASMDREKQKEIASKGGRSVPSEKRSFSQNRQLAAKAGRKGGQSVAPENRSFYKIERSQRKQAAKAGKASMRKIEVSHVIASLQPTPVAKADLLRLAEATRRPEAV